ncbi:Mms4p PWA37_005274 [Arxiozyma heterogenica]|uniref:ERCC4 domain-containing protein n=1 Tax=Arxiozyma heterogenica TaxID=278026 RepID=A0AAN7WR04_9SACH|nr:hypothetical protein RI543_000207 [Kazachstania heterogenica]
MQEVIELSDSITNSGILNNNEDQIDRKQDDHIEIIDLSITDYVTPKAKSISSTVEFGDPLPSSPTTCHVNLVGNASTSIDESSYYYFNSNNINKNHNINDNNSIELSAPLIYDVNEEITDNSECQNIKRSLIELNATFDNIPEDSSNKDIEPNKIFLDNIVNDNNNDSISDSDLSFNKPLKNRSYNESTGTLKDNNFRPIDIESGSQKIEESFHLLPTGIDKMNAHIVLQEEQTNIERQPTNNSKSTLPDTISNCKSQEQIIRNEKIQSKTITIYDNVISKPIDDTMNVNSNRSDSKKLNDSQNTNNTIINCLPISKTSTVTKNITGNSVRIRKILSKGKPLTEDVALDIPMFLNDSDSDSSNYNLSSPPKKKLKRRRSIQNLTTNTDLDNIILPLSRAKTMDSRLLSSFNHDGIDNFYNNLKTEFEKLSQYILNGKKFTDIESKEMIQKSFRDNKDSFKKVNQLCKDNQKIREQIIVEISNSLFTIFKKEEPHLIELVQPATLQKSYDDELPLIRFLRRVDSVYDFNHDYYYPCETQIMEESEVLLYYDAKTFFQQYSRDKRILYKYIRKLVKRNKYVILILYDLNKLKKAIELIEDYRYKERVNQRLSTTTINNNFNQKNNTRLKNDIMNEIDNLGMQVFDIEQRIRFIDRHWGIKIHTVNSHQDFLQSLSNLITIIAKKRMDPALRFMKYAHINVRSGSDKTDILKKTLHEIGRIPDMKTRSITKQYPNLQELFQDFSIGQLQSGLDGRYLMTEKMEARLCKLFTCRNPDEVID